MDLVQISIKSNWIFFSLDQLYIIYKIIGQFNFIFNRFDNLLFLMSNKLEVRTCFTQNKKFENHLDS